MRAFARRTAMMTLALASFALQAQTAELKSGYYLRAGPGTNYLHFNISRPRRVTISRYSGDGQWARIIFGNGQVAWVSARAVGGARTAVAPVRAPTPSAAAPVPLPMPTVRPVQPAADVQTPMLPAALTAVSEQDDITSVKLDTSANGDRVRAHASAMRYDTVAARGACTLDQIKTDADARAMISYYEIKDPGATATERLNLANGLFQASALYGGRFAPLVGVTIKFNSRRGLSRYLPGLHEVDLNRCDRAGRGCGGVNNINIARLMHELGHAANNKAPSLVRPFPGCYPTAYSSHNQQENTAEIFSAYLTRPTLLTQGSAACRRAYTRYAQVFKANGRFSSCDTKPRQDLLARIQGLGDGEEMASAFAPRASTIESASLARPASASSDGDAQSAL